MSDEAEIADEYRIRAEEIRTKAAHFQYAFTRDMFARIAQDYDHMARTLETIDRSKQAIERLSTPPRPRD